MGSKPLFCGRDVASALGYKKPFDAIAQHVEADDSVKCGLIDSLGREQLTTFINESGPYALIMGSKLESARRFQALGDRGGAAAWCVTRRERRSDIGTLFCGTCVVPHLYFSKKMLLVAEDVGVEICIFAYFFSYLCNQIMHAFHGSTESAI